MVAPSAMPAGSTSNRTAHTVLLRTVSAARTQARLRTKPSWPLRDLAVRARTIPSPALVPATVSATALAALPAVAVALPTTTISRTLSRLANVNHKLAKILLLPVPQKERRQWQRKKWTTIRASSARFDAPIARRPPPHCGDATKTATISATLAVSTISYTAHTDPSE